MKDPSKEFMMPFIAALTTLLWLETALEALTRGGMHAPTSLSDLYLTLMGAYAGAGEVQKWLQKIPQDPAQDPWLEKAQKGGAFVALWMVLLIAVHLWQLQDSTVRMPVDLKPITTGLVLIFFAKVASRHVRRSQRGVGGPVGSSPSGVEEQRASARGELLALLAQAPEGFSMEEVVERLPGYSRRHLMRELSSLTAGHSIERTGSRHHRDLRFRRVPPRS